ncbi:MAG TPA: hypothetical protein VFQ53_36695 [Kofleriaceae bacterium]|nr:hypothetical protein [Kofleriaceae bacterium]
MNARATNAAGLACAALLAMSTSADAQGVTAAPPNDDVAPEVSFAIVGGVASAPFVAMDFPHVDGSAAAFVLAARAHVRGEVAVGARIPLALVDVGQPAGSYVGQAAWGNPELFVEESFATELGRPVFVRARLAIGAPLAEHGSPGLLENRALAIADAMLAWRDRELFVPGVVPITPAGELALPFGRWSVRAIAKLPVLVRVSSQASGEGASNAVGLAPVLGVGAGAAITSRLQLTAGIHAAFDLVRPLVWVDPASRVQTSMQADLAWHIHGSLRLGATLLVPLGGALGGDTVAAGLSLAHGP